MKKITSSLKQNGVKFFDEFKSFALKGNVIDMAFGVIIGTAFSKIVSSLVADIIMPLIGVIIGNIDIKDLSITLQEKTALQDAIVLRYGLFLQTLFDFVLIALSIFVAFKLIITVKTKILQQEINQGKKPTEVELLTEIRDLLKERSK